MRFVSWWPVVFHNIMSPLSLYIHWPFCLKKCPYCDFNSHVRESELEQERWLQAYFHELDYYKDRLKDRKLVSIFFGGGTPSLMSEEMVERLLGYINDIWSIKEAEITLEANPTSFEAEKFKAFKRSGVNRISLGIQALNDNDLKFLGREHSVSEALGALDKAAGIFKNYSFDLIYARPHQTLAQWEKELEQAIKLINGHISLYQLTIEKGTKFYSAYQNKEFELPNEELSAQLYEITAKMLGKEQLYPYEISNYAKRGYESQHNLAYWYYQEYLGIGAGAHSRLRLADNIIGRQALMNIHNPQQWLKAVEEKGHALQNNEIVGQIDMELEMIMMGLRIASGINKQLFTQETGKNLLNLLNIDVLNQLKESRLLEEDEHSIRLTIDGMLLHQSIINQLVI